jgi:hypothetical protein
MAKASPYDLSEAQNVPITVSPDLDPRLQWWVARRQAGSNKAATASTGRNEVAVVAKVSNPDAWEALSEVRTPTLVGTTPEQLSIVTGRIPISRAEAVRAQPFVKSLKASQDLRPLLDKTTEETEARPDLLPPSHLANGGSGTVIGVIDYGGDFAHDNFRLNDGTTRLLALWNQNAAATATSPFDYGREYTPAAINLALQEPILTLRWTTIRRITRIPMIRGHMVRM